MIEQERWVVQVFHKGKYWNYAFGSKSIVKSRSNATQFVVKPELDDLKKKLKGKFKDVIIVPNHLERLKSYHRGIK